MNRFSRSTDWLAVVVAAAVVIIAVMFFAALALSAEHEMGSIGTNQLAPIKTEPFMLAAKEERSEAQVYAFRKTHPCPALTSGIVHPDSPCPGWVVDHIVPLCWGGKDDPSNMAWEEQRASYRKDVFERAACAMKKKYEAIKELLQSTPK